MSRQEQKSYVVVLIDADVNSYMFDGRFVTKGDKGGEEAADALLAALEGIVRDLPGETNGMKILVRAFANLNGLGAALQRDGRLADKDQLRAFTAGFNNRNPFFDFVDIRSAEDRVDLKVRANIKLFLDNLQCKHLVLACGKEDGYAPWLGQFVGDKQVTDRITLLESSPLSTQMKNLRLRTVRLSPVPMKKIAQPAVSTGWVSPAKKRAIATAVVPKTPDVSRCNDTPELRMRAMPSNLQRGPKPMKLEDVLLDEHNRRIDKPLLVNRAVAENRKRKSLCYNRFLRGQCSLADCWKNHDHDDLTTGEFNALWELARLSTCSRKGHTGRECMDAQCYRSHERRASGRVTKATRYGSP